jgi:hypothetical protein
VVAIVDIVGGGHNPGIRAYHPCWSYIIFKIPVFCTINGMPFNWEFFKNLSFVTPKTYSEPFVVIIVILRKSISKKLKVNTVDYFSAKTSPLLFFF